MMEMNSKEGEGKLWTLGNAEMSTESIQLLSSSNQLSCIGHLSTRNFIAESISRIVVDNSILTNHEISIPHLQMIDNKLLRQQSTRISIRGVSRARHHFVSLPCTDFHVRLRPAVIQNWKLTTTGESSPFRFNSSQRRGILGLKSSISDKLGAAESPSSEILAVRLKIEAIETKIEAIEIKVEAIEICLSNDKEEINNSTNIHVRTFKSFTRDELREKQRQLRKEEIQLREEKLILLKSRGKASYFAYLE